MKLTERFINMVLEYRSGKTEDITAIISLIHDAIIEMEKHGIYQWDEIYPTEKDFIKDIMDENLYVAMNNEKIVALYVISDESDDAYNYADWKYPDDTAYILHRFCIAPDYQNKGLGKQILLKIENQIRDMGYKSVRLDVFTENPFAQNLYRHNGYEARGVAVWRKGRFDLMEKIL